MQEVNYVKHWGILKSVKYNINTFQNFLCYVKLNQMTFLHFVPALPHLSSIVHVNDISSNSLQLNFVAWSETTGAGSVPYGYTVQWRVEGNPIWNNAVVIRHAETERRLITRILGLKPATAYLIRVVPFIIDHGVQYDGNTSREFGLYNTNMEELYHSMQRTFILQCMGVKKA